MSNKSSTKNTPYICIDTNNFIQCCLLQIKGDNIEALQGIREILDANKAKLLLPEVIKLEFYKILNKRTVELNNKINELKEYIGRQNYDEKIEEELMGKITEVIDLREKNIAEVQTEIDGIFEHQNTTEIALSPNILINAYKFFLSGKKPYKKEGDFSVSSDALIITSIQEHLNNITNYELYFCSLNTTDFCDNNNTKTKTAGKIPVHNDIAAGFIHFEYYRTLFELLNDHFGGKYGIELIEKIAVEEDTLINDGLAESTTLEPTEVKEILKASENFSPSVSSSKSPSHTNTLSQSPSLSYSNSDKD